MIAGRALLWSRGAQGRGGDPVGVGPGKGPSTASVVAERPAGGRWGPAEASLIPCLLIDTV